MRVIVDIVHPADINFYRNAIRQLQKKNVDVTLIFRPLGNIANIIRKELPNMPFKSIGRHYSLIPLKIYGIVERDLKLLHYLRKVDFDIVTSFAGFYIAQASKILRKPSVLFYDDYEYKLNFNLCKLSASRFVIMPHTIPVTGKTIIKHNGLKELAYLHPKYFEPNQDVLKQFGLKSQYYVFLREKEYVGLNYRKQGLMLADIAEHIHYLGFDTIAMSYYEKTKEKLKNAGCTIIEKPTDVHSLLSFAAFTIAAGDTMARESCLVGTPAIYTGNREMYANDEFIKRGCMFKAITKQSVINTIKDIMENDIKSYAMERMNYAIKHEWKDTTEIIIENIYKVME